MVARGSSRSDSPRLRTNKHCLILKGSQIRMRPFCGRGSLLERVQVLVAALDHRLPYLIPAGSRRRSS